MKQKTKQAIEGLMIFLGLFTVALFIYQITQNLTYEQNLAIIITDTIICGIFWIEFIVFAIAERFTKNYVKRRLPDLIGMIPMPGINLINFRWVRILRLFRLFRAEAMLTRLFRSWRLFRIIRPTRYLKRKLK